MRLKRCPDLRTNLTPRPQHVAFGKTQRLPGGVFKQWSQLATDGAPRGSALNLASNSMRTFMKVHGDLGRL